MRCDVRDLLSPFISFFFVITDVFFFSFIIEYLLILGAARIFRSECKPAITLETMTFKLFIVYQLGITLICLDFLSFLVFVFMNITYFLRTLIMKWLGLFHANFYVGLSSSLRTQSHSF